MPNWKVKTHRDHKYLRWIASLPCTICGAPNAVAHHSKSGGMGIKGPDNEVVPLCVFCHHEVHNNYSKNGYWTEKQLKQLLEELNANYKELNNNGNN